MEELESFLRAFLDSTGLQLVAEKSLYGVYRELIARELDGITDATNCEESVRRLLERMLDSAKAGLRSDARPALAARSSVKARPPAFSGISEGDEDASP